MSVYFVTGESLDVWNPSNLVARLFLAQIDSVSSEIGVCHGLGALVSDEVVVDSSQLTVFAAAFNEFFRGTDSGSAARALLRSCISIVFALSRKLGAKLPDDPETACLVEEGQRVVGQARSQG